MAGDSIALLQERFRQLQKDKQRRKEKELLRKLSGPEKIAPKMPFERREESFQSGSKRAQLPTVEDSLSLGLNNMKQQDEEARRRPMAMFGKWKNFEHGDSSAESAPIAPISEVDTTLHL